VTASPSDLTPSARKPPRPSSSLSQRAQFSEGEGATPKDVAPLAIRAVALRAG
jgi:hypothetical protein